VINLNTAKVLSRHLGLGKFYRRTGQREQAQEHLTTATTMYREMGMTYWLEKAEQPPRLSEGQLEDGSTRVPTSLTQRPTSCPTSRSRRASRERVFLFMNPGGLPLGDRACFLFYGLADRERVLRGSGKISFHEPRGFWIMRGANPGEFLFYGLADRERVGR